MRTLPQYMWDKWGRFLIKKSKFTCIYQQLLSLHLLEAITFDPDVQIEKTISRWKYRDKKKTLELVSMDEIMTIIP
jgi:hypothetical protein